MANEVAYLDAQQTHQERHEELRALRKIRDELRRRNINTAEVDVRINQLGIPRVGELLFLDEGQSAPVLITEVRSSGNVVFVPTSTQFRSTHQGNLYDEKGEAIYG